MKRNIINYLSTFFTLLLLFTTSACVDKFGFSSWWDEDSYTFLVNLPAPQSVSIQSRANGNYDENRVYDLTLLVFDKNGNDAASKLKYVFQQDFTGNPSASDRPDASTTYEFKFSGVELGKQTTYRIYAIANLFHAAKAYETTATDLGNKLKNLDLSTASYTIADLKKESLAATSSIREAVEGQNAGPIMMGTMYSNTVSVSDGGTNLEGGYKTGNAGGTVNGIIYLSRADAKVTFRVKGTANNRFTLTNYSVLQIPRHTVLYGDTHNPVKEAMRKDYLTITPTTEGQNNYQGQRLDGETISGSDLPGYFTYDLVNQDIEKNSDQSFNFDFYMPENRNKPIRTITAYNQREIREKDEHNKNKLAEDTYDDPLKETPLYDRFARRRLWQYANQYSTYVLLEGEYEGSVKKSELEALVTEEDSETRNKKIADIASSFPAGKDEMTITAHVQYFVHLGKCGNTEGNLNDFDVLRNTHYTYEVTVKGINKIFVEAKTNEEHQSGAEGTIIVQSTPNQVLLDSHNETILMKFTRDEFVGKLHTVRDYTDFISYRVFTPFNDLYALAEQDMQTDPTQDPANAAWLRFALCNKDENGNYIPELMSYGKIDDSTPAPQLMSIDDLILRMRDALKNYQGNILPPENSHHIAELKNYKMWDKPNNENLFDNEGNLYVTCYVNENFYDEKDSNYDGSTTDDDTYQSQATTFYGPSTTQTEEQLYKNRMTGSAKESYQTFLANSTRKIPYSLIRLQNRFRNTYWKYYVNTPPRAFYLLTGSSQSKDLQSRIVEPRFIIQQRSIQSPYTNDYLYDRTVTFADSQLAPLERAFGVEVVDETRVPWKNLNSDGWQSQERNQMYYTGDSRRMSPTARNRDNFTQRYDMYNYVSNNITSSNDATTITKFDYSNGMYNTLNSEYGIWKMFIGDNWKNVVYYQNNGYKDLTEAAINEGYDGMLDTPYNGMTYNYTPNFGLKYMVFGCLQRNRDINRNGKIEKEELQWYLPAMGQLIGIELATDVYHDKEAYLIREGVEVINKKHQQESPHWWENTKRESGRHGYYLWQVRYISSTYRLPFLWSVDMYHMDRYIYSSQTDVNYAYRCVRNLGKINVHDASTNKDAGPQNFVQKLTKVVGNERFSVLTSAYMPRASQLEQPRRDERNDFGGTQFMVNKIYKNIMLAKNLIKVPSGSYFSAKDVGTQGSLNNTTEGRDDYWLNGILIKKGLSPCDMLNHPTFNKNGELVPNTLYTENGSYDNWRTPTAPEMAMMINVNEVPANSNPKEFYFYSLNNQNSGNDLEKALYTSGNIASSTKTFASVYWLSQTNIGWSPTEEKMSRAYGGNYTRCVRDITDSELLQSSDTPINSRSRASVNVRKTIRKSR